MSAFIFNIAKGRIQEFHKRVNDNDPANSAFVILLLSAMESDATLQDYDDLSNLLGAAGNTEATATNYARKTITDADIAAATVDDTNNRVDLDMPDQVWTTLGGATNNNIKGAILCYDSDTTGGTDANLIPVAGYNTTDTDTNGSDFTLAFNASGYARAA